MWLVRRPANRDQANYRRDAGIGLFMSNMGWGRADEWDANQTLQRWTLHAGLYEYNPDGVFAPHNPRVQ